MKVGLCIPCYDGRVHDALMSGLLDTFREAAKKDIELQLIIGRGNPVLPDVRNWLVAMALSYDCDKVWFVDSDISWKGCIAETLNMLHAPVDIVAGVHQNRNIMWNDPPKLVVAWDKIPPKQDEASGLYEVKSVATAFVCIDRSVFDRMAESGIAQRYLPKGDEVRGMHLLYYRDYFDTGFEAVSPPPETLEYLASIGYEGPYRILRGEDFNFCEKAKSVGAKVFVDPRISLTHFDGCVQHNVSLKDVDFRAVTEAVAESAA